MEVLITGASKGIGRASAFAAAEDGHRVLALARSEDALREMASQDDRILPMPLDLKEEGAGEALEKMLQGAGVDRLDGVLSAAGALDPKPFQAMGDPDWEDALKANLIGPARVLRHLHPYLKKGKNAHVVLLGSMAGYPGSQKVPGLSAYGAAKAALAALGEALAEEWKEDGIRVNTLALGGVETEMFAKAFPDQKAPVGPERMASYLLSFLKEGGGVMTGKHLPISLSSP